MKRCGCCNRLKRDALFSTQLFWGVLGIGRTYRPLCIACSKKHPVQVD